MDSTRNPNSHLAPIDDTDFKVADGDPDPRGWDVISADGKEIGEVDDLIIDTSAMKVRYLVCDLDEDELGLEDDRDRHVLIPVGRARLSPDDKKLMLDGVTAREILTAPPFTGVVSDQHESFGTTGRSAAGGMTDTGRSPSEVRLTRSEEELAVGKRERPAGEVHVSKHVERDTVREPVDVRREEVEIERRPVTEARSGDVRIRDEEVHIPLKEEEIVVDKRPVVKEELVVKKHPKTETRVVEEEVRKERLDVERNDRGNDHPTR
jgi:uncharacterized protein (TIGR02271 family)